MRASIALRLLLLAAAAASCARKLPPPSPQDPAARAAILLTAHDLAPGRRCRIVDAAAALPNVSTVLDTAAMPVYLRQAGVAAADTGYALFSVRFDTTGTPVRARLIEATLPDSLHAAMEQAVASALVERGAASPLAVRLRIDFAPVQRYRLGKSEYCDPERIVHRAAPDPRSLQLPVGPMASRSVSTVNFDVDISATGQVVGVQTSSPLGESMRTTVLAERWKPALDDGMPVPARASTTERIEMRLETRPAP